MRILIIPSNNNADTLVFRNRLAQMYASLENFANVQYDEDSPICSVSLSHQYGGAENEAGVHRLTQKSVDPELNGQRVTVWCTVEIDNVVSDDKQTSVLYYLHPYERAVNKASGADTDEDVLVMPTSLRRID